MRKVKDNSTIKNWLRGGQIVDHNIRMFRQTAKRVSLFSLFVSLVYVAAYTNINTSNNDRTLVFNYYQSFLMNEISGEQGVNTFVYNNKLLKIKHSKVISSNSFINAKNNFKSTLLEGFIQSLILSFLIYMVISFYIGKYGKNKQDDKFLRGGAFISNQAFTKSLKKKQINQDLRLGEVPTLKGIETIHFEISGATGTGKSQTLKHLIKDIKSRGDRAIIYSSSTEFISEFYDESRDIILNPLDDRSPNWSIWNEVEEIYHYDDIAASLIPDVEGDQGDPIWKGASRLLFADIARKLKENGGYSTKLFIDSLLIISNERIKKIIDNTLSTIIFSGNENKIADSVRFTLVESIKSLRFLTNDRGSFSIRKWVKNEKEEKNSGFVFISSLGDQHEVLKSLISCWMDIFASSILSLPEDRDRRIWLIIDELPSLNKLKSLKRILAESRKYGCCVVIGYQSYSEVESIYGKKGAESLSDLTASKIFFRSNDYFNANHTSQQLGKEEIKTTNENLAMGAHQGRDSISITETEKQKELVLPTEITNLKNLHGFYRLPGNHPVVSFKQTLFKKGKIQVDGFVNSKKTNHIYMLEGGSDDSDNLGGNFSDNLSDNLSNNPDDVEIDLTETNFNSVPDYVAMEIPLDKEQYSLNLNTGVDTSQDEDKSEKVEQFDKEQYSSNLNTNVKTSQNENENEGEDEKVEQSIMSRGLD